MGLTRVQPSEDWEGILAEQLPLLGHRNWVVIADAAYPASSSAGIETVVAKGDPMDAVHHVLAQVSACRHVRANIYTDLELDFVDEQDAPGVSRYRQELAALLKDVQPLTLPHEQILFKLDQCARMFRVLIIKTELTIPYTSVFLELDCGYWNAEAEQRLRDAMAAESQIICGPCTEE
jgi:D-ribose pyranose/furanose isomerase RbsD